MLATSSIHEHAYNTKIAFIKENYVKTELLWVLLILCFNSLLLDLKCLLVYFVFLVAG